MSEKKWMDSGFAKSTTLGTIEADKGIIPGVSVCTVGEAKGHGVSLDSEFIETVRAFGAAKKQGLKARFGHPNMCSTALGTFIGRFKNFTIDGDQVRADLFLSNEAKETPNGNLHSYVLGLATNEPDMFGTSIVFTPGRIYRRDGNEKVFMPGSSVGKGERGADWTEYDALDAPDFVECEALHACDAVDDPAANEGGLFSAFSQETVAGQITEFLDLNPQIWQALESNPSITEALGRYGDKMDGFVERYRETRKHSKGGQMTTPNKAEEAAALAAKEAEAEAKLKAEKEATELAAKEAKEKEATELAEKEKAEALEAERLKKEEEDGGEAGFSRETFKQIHEEFGAEIAAQTMLEGGDYNTALKLHAKQLNAKNEALEAQVKELKASGKGSPTPVAHVEDGKKAKKTVFRGGMPEDKA